MKRIGLCIVAIFLLSCQDESSSDTISSTTFTDAGDTLIFFRQPEVNAFELPVCTGYYDCPAMDCIDIDCEGQKLFATSCSAIFYPLKCTDNQGTSSIVVMISGVSYGGGEHCVGSGEVSMPFYNGHQGDAPQGSKFDTPPLNTPSAGSQGLAIDVNTGAIDIDQLVVNGIFGNPAKKGAEKKFRMYYRLNDKSHLTLNYTDITFRYDPLTTFARVADDGPGTGTVIIVKSCQE
jgi:hypothetical protein